MADKLYSKHSLGSLRLPNRVVMAPMTRCRSPENKPSDLVATYYAQRSEAGLLISEGTSPSPNGLGYANIPGLFQQDQVESWRRVTDAIHQAGGRIFVQLMHTGRVGHELNLPSGARLLGPSAVAAPGEMFTLQEGPQPIGVPEEMSAQDILEAIEEYGRAAGLAIDAGFDGVELHGANGYLIDQFFNTASNHRKDEWGSSVQGRRRFASKVTRRVAAEIGAERVGIRVSPYGAFNGMEDDQDSEVLFTSLAREMSTVGLSYMHLVDHSSMGAPPVPEELKRDIRKEFSGTLILSGGYDSQRAEADLVADKGDLIAFGRPFISNPQLVSRLRRGASLVEPDQATFYQGGEEGYIDYPLDA